MPVSRPKPERHLNYDAVHRLLTITVGAEVFRYTLAPDGGEGAYRMGRLDGGAFSPTTTYHLTLSPGGARCDCLGCVKWNHCKHASALEKLAALGRLPKE